ncbi:hypothetical protein ABIB73_003322 [Bradyrhizobium sp. F1.4.3]|uniref:hypothetical protein n=1 Tax=Bradyrhizobium sp. F1.4.3 TaxID=3156356 RepID=UPI0033963FA8
MKNIGSARNCPPESSVVVGLFDYDFRSKFLVMRDFVANLHHADDPRRHLRWFGYASLLAGAFARRLALISRNVMALSYPCLVQDARARLKTPHGQNLAAEANSRGVIRRTGYFVTKDTSTASADDAN